MRALYDTLTHKFTRDEINEGTKWILFFAGACYLQAGLMGFAQGSQTAWMLTALGAGILVLASVRFYVVRLLALIAWTAFLAFDYMTRQNLFAVAFFVVCVFHLYKMIRHRKTKSEDIV